MASPLETQLRKRFSIVRPVSQVRLRLAGDDQGQAFSEAQRHALSWMANRAGRPLPVGAWEGLAFDLQDVGAQRTSAVSIDNPRYWAARQDDADKDVAQRIWTTEIAIGRESSGEAIFGCRLQCVTRGDNPPFVPSTPGLVRQIIEGVGAYLDGVRLPVEPWLIDDEDSANNFCDFLCNRKRSASVIVFSLPEDSSNPEETIVSTGYFMRSVLGAAHVAIVTGNASYELIKRMGKEFSVFRQAVRTYRPGLDLDSDNPFDHPLALPLSIQRWSQGETGFVQFLISETLRATVSDQDLERKLPTFSVVHRIAIDQEREKLKSSDVSVDELLEHTIDENQKLRKEVQEQKETYDGLLVTHDEDNRKLTAELDEARKRISDLRGRVDRLQHAVSTRDHHSSIEPFPSSLNDMENWARQNLSGSVFIHNRALREARRSIFENVDLVYSVLTLLRDKYITMRIDGGLKLKQNYDLSLRELGLEESACFVGPRMGEERDAYFIVYKGIRREMDRHIKGSNSRDPRYAFRLYFFWDEDDHQVVIGWLPSHLPTRIT